MNGLLLKPLPYRAPDSLVVLSTISQRYNSDRLSVSYADILDWKAQTDVFTAVAAVSPQSFDVTSGGEPERVSGVVGDREYFRVFTDPPVIGRTFHAEDDQPEANRVVVLSYRFWMRRFGGDSQVLGASMDLRDVAHEIMVGWHNDTCTC